MILEINDYGNNPFKSLLPLKVDENQFLCKTYTLNIKVIEATDVPAMNLNGKSDPYIIQGKNK